MLDPKDTPYLALTGELWGAFCEYLWENWPCCNGIALYFVQLSQLTSVFQNSRPHANFKLILLHWKLGFPVLISGMGKPCTNYTHLKYKIIHLLAMLFTTWFATHCFSNMHCMQCIVQYNYITAPSHYWIKWWIIVNLTLANNLQWNFKQNTIFFNTTTMRMTIKVISSPWIN